MDLGHILNTKKQCARFYIATSPLILVIIQLSDFCHMGGYFILFNFYLFDYFCVFASLLMLASFMKIPFL